jgi:hypothetical protein
MFAIGRKFVVMVVLTAAMAIEKTYPRGTELEVVTPPRAAA